MTFPTHNIFHVYLGITRVPRIIEIENIHLLLMKIQAECNKIKNYFLHVRKTRKQTIILNYPGIVGEKII